MDTTIQWESLDGKQSSSTAGPDEKHDDNVVMEDSTSQSATVVTVAATASPSDQQHVMTGRPSTMLYLSCDPDHFSDFQVAVRKSIEFFEANHLDVQTSTQGRNKPIVLGQVGIRCRYCRHLPIKERKRGCQYFPSQLQNIYQAAQNLANPHLVELCPLVPDAVRNELVESRREQQDTKSSVGKDSWGARALELGVFESADGMLRFAKTIDHFHHRPVPQPQGMNTQ